MKASTRPRKRDNSTVPKSTTHAGQRPRLRPSLPWRYQSQHLARAGGRDCGLRYRGGTKVNNSRGPAAAIAAFATVAVPKSTTHAGQRPRLRPSLPWRPRSPCAVRRPSCWRLGHAPGFGRHAPGVGWQAARESRVAESTLKPGCSACSGGGTEAGRAARPQLRPAGAGCRPLGRAATPPGSGGQVRAEFHPFGQLALLVRGRDRPRRRVAATARGPWRRLHPWTRCMVARRRRRRSRRLRWRTRWHACRPQPRHRVQPRTAPRPRTPPAAQLPWLERARPASRVAASTSAPPRQGKPGG
jgi:hypothetical protein